MTVTERWVAENLQNSDLLPLTQVTLKAANRLEIPYSGVVIVDFELLGQKSEGVPVLVVKDSRDPPPPPPGRRRVMCQHWWG